MLQQLVAALAPLSSSETVTVSNLHPRLSTTGEIVNAHDGTYRYINGSWWMHAAQYGECADPPHHGCDLSGPTRKTSCGFEPNHNISIWRSPDLSSGSWEFVGQAVQCSELPDCGILYRPHMVYNPNTKLFVLFWNYVSKEGAYAGDKAATAPHPAGPWTVKTAKPINTTFPTGDYDVFVDRDGTGYIIYSANHLMYLEQLNPDYLSSTGIMPSIPHGIPSPSPSPPLPPPSSLKCPAGQHVDLVEDPGDNGSCDCEEFCGSDWTGSIKLARPHWKGAASAYGSHANTTKCVCVQGTHFCPKAKGFGCADTCNAGAPTPMDYCVPGAAPTPPPAPATPIVAFPVDFVEAPAMFERSGIYYALFGHCCCFCYQGSGMFVFTAPHPLGPWTQQSQPLSAGLVDLGCTANAETPTPKTNPMGKTLPLTATVTSGQGCVYKGAKAASVSQAQQNFVIEIPPSGGEDAQSDFIWTGDRWMQAPDGMKGHEPQYWGRLHFDAKGVVQRQVFEESITFATPPATK